MLKLVVRMALFSLSVTQGILAILPVCFLIALHQCARRAAELIGHWPVPMIENTTWIEAHDAIYQRLCHQATRLDMPVFQGFFLWFVLMALGWRWYSPRLRWLHIGLFLAGYGLLWFYPGNVLAWWLD